MYKTILLPVDISEPELTQQVIPHVEALAKLDDSQIHFITVIPSSRYHAALGLAVAVVADKDYARNEATALLNETVKQFSIPKDRVEIHVVTGAPKDQILKLADSIDADLIVLGSHRPGITTYLLGSNAAAVVRHAKCPVLVVR
jgi:universal stress protein F